MGANIKDEISGKVETLEASEVMDNASLNEILKELNSPEPSEAMKTALIADFLAKLDNSEFLEVMGGAGGNEMSVEIDNEEASEATETPLSVSLSDSPANFRDAMFPYPFKDSLGCERSFSHLRYAKNRSKVHNHHIRCHIKSCRSKFNMQDNLEMHIKKIHGLGDIADLDFSFKGRLIQIDGKYHCRFRKLLGCNKTFSQNGHANRHALLHCKEAISCDVRGCRKKFMKRNNWEAHFWASHHQETD